MFYIQSDVGFYDRLVIQEMLKDLAQTQQISRDAPREYKGDNLLLFIYY